MQTTTFFTNLNPIIMKQIKTNVLTIKSMIPALMTIAGIVGVTTFGMCTKEKVRDNPIYSVNAATPEIKTQPAGKDLLPNDSYTLKVEAFVYSGTLSYQWYKDGAPISGATQTTYAVPTNEAGSWEFHVIVTCTNNERSGDKTASVSSNKVKINVGLKTPPEPSFSKMFATGEYEKNATAKAALEVEMSPENAVIKREYVWYKSTSEDGSGAMQLGDTIKKTASDWTDKGVSTFYMFPRDTVGTWYVWVDAISHISPAANTEGTTKKKSSSKVKIRVWSAKSNISSFPESNNPGTVQVGNTGKNIGVTTGTANTDTKGTLTVRFEKKNIQTNEWTVVQDWGDSKRYSLPADYTDGALKETYRVTVRAVQAADRDTAETSREWELVVNPMTASPAIQGDAIQQEADGSLKVDALTRYKRNYTGVRYDAAKDTAGVLTYEWTMYEGSVATNLSADKDNDYGKQTSATLPKTASNGKEIVKSGRAFTCKVTETVKYNSATHTAGAASVTSAKFYVQ
jgi:hypothetical protein